MYILQKKKMFDRKLIFNLSLVTVCGKTGLNTWLETCLKSSSVLYSCIKSNWQFEKNISKVLKVKNSLIHWGGMKCVPRSATNSEQEEETCEIV